MLVDKLDYIAGKILDVALPLAVILGAALGLVGIVTALAFTIALLFSGPPCGGPR